MASNVQLLQLEPESILRLHQAPTMSSPVVKLKLSNLSSGNVAFKVKTTAPDAYFLRPTSGTLKPREFQEVHIIFRLRDADADTSSHRFLVLAVPVQSSEDVSREQWGIFPKDTIQQQRLGVVLEPVKGTTSVDAVKIEIPTDDLKVKYDELVNYTTVLEKDKKHLEVELAKHKGASDSGSCGVLEKDKKRLEVELAKHKGASDSGSCGNLVRRRHTLQMVVAVALGFLLAHVPKLIFEKVAWKLLPWQQPAKSTNS